MAGRHPKAMRPADERAHPVIQDAIDRGYVDNGAEYEVNGIASHNKANDARLSIARAGRHFNLSTPCWVVDEDGEPCGAGCEAPDTPHGVRFRLHSKDQARAHLLRQTGGDPSKLKYNPYARPAMPRFSDDGRPSGQ